MSLKKNIMLRIALVYFLMLAGGVSILARIGYIQVVEGENLRDRARVQTLRMQTLESERGDILSADGYLLASSIPYYDIRFDPLADGISGRNERVFKEGIDSLCYRLSRLFPDKSSGEYKRLILQARASRNRNLLLRSRVDFYQLKKLKEFPLFRLGRNRGGIIIETDNRRIYPYGDLAYRTIGYFSRADTTVGIEGSYNEVLRGKNGSEFRRKITGGGWMPIPNGNASEPVQGMDVQTTLDVRIQDLAQAALRRQLLSLGADHGSVIVMETESGDIKAISSLQRVNGTYQERYNYAIGESVEPGSTFKLASYMALLEDDFVEPEDLIDNENGSWRYKGHVFRDDDPKKTSGILTVEQAFALSSNPAIARLMVQHYGGKEQQFLKRLSDFHLTEPVGMQIAGEGKPFFQDPETKHQKNGWSDLSLPMMSTGYELRLAPVQTLTFYNAVANGGKMVKPRLVKAILRDGSVVKSFSPEVISYSICSHATLKKIQQLMEAVVTYGTARGINTPQYRIAGKTGTAQIAAGAQGYGTVKRHYASFAGYFPADRPKFSCIVTVYAPSSGAYAGAMAAAPVFREVADRIFSITPDLYPVLSKDKETVVHPPASKSGNYEALVKVLKSLDIPYDNQSQEKGWINTKSGEESIAITDREIPDRLVPNVQDMGLKDALYLLENAGLRVQVRGAGRVRVQSLLPGSRIRQGQSIMIELG